MFLARLFMRQPSKRGFCLLVLVRGKVTLDCKNSGLMKGKEREAKREKKTEDQMIQFEGHLN